MKRTHPTLISLAVLLVLGGTMLALGSRPLRARTMSGIAAEDAAEDAWAPGAVSSGVGTVALAAGASRPRKHTRTEDAFGAMEGAGGSGELPTEDASEIDPDESTTQDDNRPEQKVWRTQWALEEHNPEWTQRMQDELHARAKASLHGDIDILEPSCRESLCIMHIKFADDLDVKAFQEASRGPDFHYELQSLDPNYNGEGFNEADFEYELIIKRGAVD
jgi:hypothetical protein